MVSSAFRFFYDQLPNDLHRKFYSLAEAAVGTRQKKLDFQHIPGLTASDYMRILEYVYDDHPEFFSFFPLKSRIRIQGIFARIDFFYRFSPGQQREYEEALNRRTDRILSQCFPDGYAAVSELRREKTIFDWITRNVIYDQRSLDDLQKQEKGYLSSSAWNAYGALVLGKAVCEGIACAFKHLCNCVGIPCIVVIGNVKGLGRHAWNKVRIQGKFYNVDCTWDLRSSISLHIPYARYRYFNIPDRILNVTHTAEAGFLPVCGSLQFNPFRIRGLVAEDREQAFRIIREQADKGAGRFAILCLRADAKEIAPQAAERLSVQTGRRVEYFMDDSGYFLGFTTEGFNGVVRL